jgi:large subunit ribosomal protein L28
MSHRCSISNKCRQHGHRVSHANNKTKHVFMANVHTKKFWVAEEKRTVPIKVSTKMMRTIDKIGLEAALRKYGLTLAEVRRS